MTVLNNRKTVVPNELDFNTHGRRDYNVIFEHPSSWEFYLVPLTVIVGEHAQPGQGMYVNGSTHGNEYEGPIVIKSLLHSLRETDVLGRIILIPVLNVAAFRSGTRDTVEDGVNLNRAFPGSPKGSWTHRLADFVTQSIFPQVHVVFDLHAGGQTLCFPPLPSFHHDLDDSRKRLETEELARGFGTKFTLAYQNTTPGLLTSCAESLGKITLGAELGYGESVSPVGIATGNRGVLNALMQSGQLKKNELPSPICAPQDQVLVDTSDSDCSLLAEFDGYFEPAISIGTEVQKGEPICYLHDFNRIDERPLKYTAPHDGFITCQAWKNRVNRGAIISQVARTIAWK